jgi:pre-mRNA-splicing factor SYF1
MARPLVDGGADSPAAQVARGIDYSDLMPKEEDLLYEEELLRTPHVTKLWWRYLEARKDSTAKRRYLIFERAIKALPGSYKVCPTLPA